MATGDWAWYKAAIKAKQKGEPLPAVSEGQPQVGFYWAKASKSGGRIPVVIFLDKNGDMVARSGTRAEHRIADAAERWSWICAHPIERDSYVFAWENGTWPDGTPTTAPRLPDGSNLPTDPFERLLAEVDDKMASASAFLDDAAAKPDKTRADRARNLQAELLALNKTANNMHVAEKAPHLAAGRAVDAKFEFRRAIEAVTARLRTVFENILKAEEAKARQEAAARHAEEQRKVEAERKRIQDEREKLRENDPIAALTSPEPELPMVPPPPEPVKVQAGGGIGRAAGLKTVWEPRIDDWKAAAAQLVSHDDPDIRAAVEKKIKALARVQKETLKIAGVVMVEARRAA